MLMLCILFCAVGISGKAQQQRFYNWYFGNKAGLSFASGSPVPLTNGQLVTNEGCASISDVTGNLLFYTDGVTVWNKNHVAMTNGTGLTGHASSTQSAIIVQKPKNPNIYYIFTADADAGPNGIRYSEVNMSLSGGLGAVTANKNILLQTPSCEKITAVRHCNNEDIWIVSHDWDSNNFRTWLLTSAGLNTTPVVSSSGVVITGINQSKYGQLKANPDGNKLLTASYGFANGGTNKFELHNFDNSTGVVSGGFTLSTEQGAYGCEFSPDGRLVYGSTNGGNLFQYNICAGTPAAITASKVQIGSLGPFIGSMQLGPDGKIYISRNTTSLSVINNPNVPGPGCNFVNGAIALAGRSSGLGLPNLASFYIRPEVNPFTYTANCLNVNFAAPTVTTGSNCSGAVNAIQGVQWNFGDPASGASNTSTQLNPNHVFSAVGTYQVTLILNLGCYYDTLRQSVSLSGFNLNMSSTPAGCTSATGTATATPAVAGTYTYLWSNGATTSTITGLTAGTYTVAVTSSGGCTANGSVTVTGGGSLNVSVNTSPASCNGSATGSANVTITGGTAPFTIAWSGGGSGNSKSNIAAGTHSVTVIDNAGCSATQSFSITEPPVLAGSIVPAVTCSTASATASISGGTAPYTYQWSHGPTTPLVNNLANGNYSVTVTDNKGCQITRSITINRPTPPSVSIATTNPKCAGSNNGAVTANVSDGTAPFSYSWNTGATSASLASLVAGNYSVSVTDSNGCTATANATLTAPAALDATVSSTSANCSGTGGSASVSVSGGTSPYTYSWSGGAVTATANGLTSGNYSVTVTDANLCEITRSVTVTQPASFSVTTSATSAFCGASNGAATASITGGTAPFTYQWNTVPAQSTPTATGLAPGSYQLVVTDLSGCSQTMNVVVPNSDGLSISLSHSNVSCFGGANGTATAQAQGGTPPYSYSWNNGATSASISNLNAGTYTATVTDSTGCVASAQVSIVQPEAITVAETTNNPGCGGNDGSIQLTVSGGTGLILCTWNNGRTGFSLDSLSAGSYQYQLEDSLNCIITGSIQLDAATTALSVNVETKNVSCYGNSDGYARVEISGGNAPYTIQWNNGVETALNDLLGNGLYSAIITDDAGCTNFITAVIESPDSLGFTYTYTGASCDTSNGSFSFNGFGGTAPYEYSLNGSAFTSNPDFGSLTSGIHQFSMRDAAGCTILRELNLPSPAGITVGVNSIVGVSCVGDANGKASVSVNGGTAPFSYTWSSGETGATATQLAAGTQFVTVRDASGCTGTATFTIPAATALDVNASITPTSCFEGSDGVIQVQLTGAQPPYQISWAGAETGSTLSGKVAGTYAVTIVDANNCRVDTTFEITQPDRILLQTTVVPGNCGEGSGSITVTATGGTGDYSYTWNSAASGATAGNLSAGSYTVTVRDENNCEATATAEIPFYPEVHVTLDSVRHVSCPGGNDGRAYISVSGGAGTYAYQYGSGLQSELPENLPAGNYQVAVFDTNGCGGTVSFVILQPAPVGVQPAVRNVNCFGGNDGRIDLDITGGTAPYQINWSNNVNGVSNINIPAGEYSFLLVDAGGCEFVDTITVGQPGELSAELNISQPQCNGSDNGSIIVQPAGGTAPYSYLWSTGSTNGGIFDLAPGEYFVNITDARGCQIQKSAQLNSQPAFSVSISGDTVLCLGESTVLFASVNSIHQQMYTFNWTHGPSQATINVTPLESRSYTVTATDPAGCAAQTSVNVTVTKASPIDIVTEKDSGCTPFCPQLKVEGERLASAIWTVAGRQYTGLEIEPCIQSVGSFTVSVSIVDSSGCTNKTTWDKELKVNPNPTAAFTPDPPNSTIDDATIQFYNYSTGASDYVYYFGDPGQSSVMFPSPAFTYRDTGTFEVKLQVTNEYGCIDEAMRTIHIGGLVAFYVPGAFSPNSDGLNDTFLPKASGLAPEGFEMRIFDRWGNEIFVSNSWEQGWDGTYKGKVVPSDMYICKIRYFDKNGKGKDHIGSVMITE